jgi:hypothetical protein
LIANLGVLGESPFMRTTKTNAKIHVGEKPSTTVKNTPAKEDRESQNGHDTESMSTKWPLINGWADGGA